MVVNMSEHKNQNLSNNRMDKFLYYAKFGLLIIVALLFMIGYSFYQQELPSATAELHLDPSHAIHESNATALIVLDFESYYSQNNFDNISFINNIVNNMEDLDYDLLLLGESIDGGTILDNIDKGLLLRIYNEKKYDYIIAIDDSAIIPAKEIQDLFLPKATLLTYNATNIAVFDAIDPVSKDSYTQQTLNMAVDINPSATKLLLIHNELILSPSTNTIFDLAKTYAKDSGYLTYETLYVDHSNINKLMDQMKNQSNDTILFYVSPDLRDENSCTKHSSLIHKIQMYTDTLIYDLSPVSQSECTRTSIRYYPIENTDKPIAYIALSPEGVCEYNYEFIDVAIANINNSKYADNASLYVNWCMENIGLNQFPDTLQEQYFYCADNSLFIDESTLQPGDLLFYKNTDNNTVEDIAIYINENVVISINQKGLLDFTKIKSEEYLVSFAHPYSTLKIPEN